VRELEIQAIYALSFSLLAKALGRVPKQSRRNVAQTLARMGSRAESAVPTLREGLKTNDPQLRVMVAETLGGIRPRDEQALSMLSGGE
jgi:hypothetical protein